MPGARLMLKVPAARAAPVPPAQTSAWALPSATALAACTIEASGVERAARTGSALLAIDTGASTTSTPEESSPSSPAGPKRIMRAPCTAAIAAPAATSDGPRSAPLQSTATVTALTCDGPGDGAEGEEAGSRAVLRVAVVVLVIVRAGRGDLATGVGPADGTHPVRSARAMALRARVQRGNADLVLGAPLRGAAVRLLFLGNRHRRPEGYQPGGWLLGRQSSFSSRSFAQRGSGGG